MSSQAFAAKLPDDVVAYINKKVPKTDIRFDGVIILPDNTIYLPLFPSLFTDVDKLRIKKTFPDNKDLDQRPDIIIFNNDFVLLKVLTDSEGHKTVLHQSVPPLQVRTGLLPQDMLVPSGLILPENIKGIIGNLKIDTKNEDVIRISEKESYTELLSPSSDTSNPSVISQLKDKVVYISTNYSKNIQVLEPAKETPKYSLAQKSIPINVRSVQNGKFLLVTSFERPFLDVISVSDSRFIKQIDLPAFPQEILVDRPNDRAFVTLPTISSIYVIDLKTMSLAQKIKVNGYCEKLILRDNKLFYVDKMRNDVWAIEKDKDYAMVNIGRFPNISAIEYKNDKVYLASRTKSRIAVVDYVTQGLISEFTTVNKPVAMKLFGNNLYVLGAQNNILQKIDIQSEKIVDNIELFTDGFSSGFSNIDDSNLAIITDVKKNKYSIVDLSKGKLLQTYSVDVPVNEVIITNRVQLF